MLRLENINKTFNRGTVDEKILFSDFNLTLAPGEFAAVVGSNGSGKTTVLNIISGDVLPESGKVFLDGEDISSRKNYVRARKIARVFQDPSMGTCPSMTIYENLSIADNKGKRFGLGRGLNRRRLDFYRETLSELGMGLEDRLGTKAQALSGGQRQALALIMATLSQPALLLLDEHTAALDPKSADTVMELTDRIIREHSLSAIMVTHNLRYAVEYGTRSIMMHEGQIVMDVSGAARGALSIDDYLARFNEISIECGN
mgnify:FL=1